LQTYRVSCAVSCVDEVFLAKAKLIATTAKLPLIESNAYNLYDFVLEVRGQVSLQSLNRQEELSPLTLDFASGAIDFRRRFGNKGGQLILRAIGGAERKVFDATAGLGRDTFILAGIGCHVTAMERSHVVGALTRDALDRAHQNPTLTKITQRINYSIGDSRHFLNSVSRGQFDTIYLDPMFPKKEKSALPKKDLRVLQLLLMSENNQIEEESKSLLELALKKCHRVVVKRPQNGKPLLEKVSVKFEGTSTRFDVYLS
jgi:16S rRNA (guanine1516-N2)-methyltransferase